MKKLLLSRLALAPAAVVVFFAGCGTVVVQSESSTGGSAGSSTGGSTGTGGAPPTDAGAQDSSMDVGAGGAGGADAKPPPMCPMDWGPTAEISGTTPLGDISVQYGWMGFLGGECGGVILAVSAAPSFDPGLGFMVLPEPPRLVFSNGTSSPMNGFVGAGETYVTLTTADSSVSAMGWVDLTQVDPWPFEPLPEGAPYPVAKGTITVTEDGWDLSGTFTVPYCEFLNIYCP